MGFNRSSRQPKQIVVLAACVLVIFILAACTRRGIPGSYLLTPLAGEPPTATLTATQTSTATEPSPTPSPLPTDTPTLSPTPSDTATPEPTNTPTITNTVTFGPSPTSTRTLTITVTPSRTRRPTWTRTMTKTRTITSTPTITLTPTPPRPDIRIVKPGVLSRVGSPIILRADLTPGDDGYVTVELIGEDGRKITEDRMDFKFYLGRDITMSAQIQFAISAAAEAGRLVVRTNDRFGRVIALSSVDLILIQAGDDQLTSGLPFRKPYLVRYPRENDVIRGGKAHIIALVRPVNGKPLILELIDQSGNVVGSTEFLVPAPTGDISHTPFELDIAYTVSGNTPVRLTLRQESDGRIPGTVSLSSVPIVLEP